MGGHQVGDSFYDDHILAMDGKVYVTCNFSGSFWIYDGSSWTETTSASLGVWGLTRTPPRRTPRSWFSELEEKPPGLVERWDAVGGGASLSRWRRAAGGERGLRGGPVPARRARIDTPSPSSE